MISRHENSTARIDVLYDSYWAWSMGLSGYDCSRFAIPDSELASISMGCSWRVGIRSRSCVGRSAHPVPAVPGGRSTLVSIQPEGSASTLTARLSLQ